LGSRNLKHKTIQIMLPLLHKDIKQIISKLNLIVLRHL